MSTTSKAAESPTISDQAPTEIKPAVVRETLRGLNVEVSKKATDSQCIDVLRTWIESNIDDEESLVKCDVCHEASDEKMDRCPFCGVGEETETKEAKVEAASTEEKGSKALAKASDAKASALAKANEKKLDEAVAEIRAINGELHGTGWSLGRKIANLLENDLWKARVGDDGSPKYKDFEVFCREELGMSPRYAHNLSDIATKFSESEFRKFGVEKLRFVLQAPEAAQAKLLQSATKQSKREVAASVRAVREDYAETHGVEHRRQERAKARKPKSHTKPTKKPEKGKVTVALMLDKSARVYLFKKDEKTGEPVPAKHSDLKKPDVKIAGGLDLTNRCKLTFKLEETSSGQLSVVVKPKRVEPNDEK